MKCSISPRSDAAPTVYDASFTSAFVASGRGNKGRLGLQFAALVGLALWMPDAAAQSRTPGGAHAGAHGMQGRAAQTISLAKIAGPDTAIHPVGNRPALHGGVVAFYGYQGATYGQDVVVALSPSDGPGLYTILAAQGDPRPDEAGSVFDHFGNPSLYGGEAIFLGGEFGTLSSTYIASAAAPYELFDDSGVSNPFLGPLGASSPATPQGISLRDPGGNTTFMGLNQDPLPCGSGTFGFQNVPGLAYVPQGGDRLVWPARVNTSDYEGNAIMGYDGSQDRLYCVADGFDVIPGLGVPFDFYFKADTDGARVAFIGMDPTSGFDRHEGVYVRDVEGLGAITLIADTLTPAPGGGAFGGFEQVSIDGNLVVFEGCAGGAGGCAVYGFFGCFVENGSPGPVFEILTTGDDIDGRPIIDLTMSPTGRDGYQFAFDVRHAANSASLYVATITRR